MVSAMTAPRNDTKRELMLRSPCSHNKLTARTFQQEGNGLCAQRFTEGLWLSQKRV